VKPKSNVVAFPIEPGLKAKGVIVARVAVDRIAGEHLPEPRELVVVARRHAGDYIFHVFESGQYQPEGNDDGA
jgi:hypothetical protein